MKLQREETLRQMGDSMTMTALARNLRALRGSRPQQEMAQTLGVTQAAYAQWETGKRQPKLEDFSRICRRLNVSADWMLGMSAAQQPGLSVRQQIAEVKRQADHAREVVDLVMDGIRALEGKI